MKEAYWGYWLIVLGIFIIVVLLLVQNYTSTNSQDFYLVKEIAEAAMEDSLDYGYYRTFGEAKINKEKFYESFIRRFAEEASLSTTYTIEFTEVFEAPPKIGVKVSSKTNSFSVFGDSESFDIVHKLDAIMESKVEASSTYYHDGIKKYRAGNYKNYADKYLNEGYTIGDFAGNNCTTKDKDNFTIIVDYCGSLNSQGLKHEKGLSSSDIICVAHVKGDPTNLVTALKETFKETLCNPTVVADGDSSIKP